MNFNDFEWEVPKKPNKTKVEGQKLCNCPQKTKKTKVSQTNRMEMNLFSIVTIGLVQILNKNIDFA